MIELADNYGFKLIYSKAYTPQASGIIERFNGTIKRLIYARMTEINSNRWIDDLPDILHNYNNSIHRSHGKTPSSLYKNPDKMEEVWNRLKKYNEQMTKNNNKELDGPRFKVGDLVLVSNRAYSSKFRKDQNVEGSWVCITMG